MATIAPYGKFYGVDDNGDPLAGGKLYTYEAGTSTPKDTYTTAAGDVANANPVILDASGLADVWLGDGGYKFILKDADDNTIFTTDDIGGDASTAFGSTVNLLTGATTINAVYANSINVCTGTFTLSLFEAASAGEGFYFVVKNASTGVITLNPNGAELIDGAATIQLLENESALVVCDGSAWYSSINAARYAVDGTASLPGFAFRTDTDTGLYYVGTNQLGLSTGGSVAETWLGSGASIKGGLSVLTIGPTNGYLENTFSTGNGAGHAIGRFDASATGTRLVFLKSRGATVGALGIVSSGDVISDISFCADDGVDYETRAAQIRVEVDGTPGANDMPGRIIFSTTADGAASVTEAMRIDQGRRILAGGVTTPATGYSNAGDISLAATNVIRANNTAKVWVNFTGTGTVTINDSFNVTSVTDNGTGDYTVNITNAIGSANFAVSASATTGYAQVGTLTTTTIPLVARNNSGTPADAATVTCIAFGD